MGEVFLFLFFQKKKPSLRSATVNFQRPCYEATGTPRPSAAG